MRERPLPDEVRRWPREDVERWIEIAGMELHDGVRPDLADQRATFALRRIRKERESR